MEIFSPSITGSTGISGSLTVTGGITGSLFGSASYATTASYALNAPTVDTGSLLTTASFNSYTGSNLSQFAGTASFATTASYILQAVSASFASTASFAPNYVLNSDTASMLAPYVLTSSTGSMTVLSSSFASTASFATSATTASNITPAFTAGNNLNYVLTSNGDGKVTGNSTLVFTGTNLGIGKTSPTATLDVLGNTNLSGSLTITGSTFLTARISGSAAANNPSSSIIMIGGTIVAPAITSTTASAVLLNPIMSASANNQTLVGLDITPTFNTGSFTGVTNYAQRISGNTLQTIDGTAALYTSNVPSATAFCLHFSVPTSTNYFLRADGSNVFLNAPATAGSIFFRQGNTTRAQIMPTTGNLILQNAGTFTDDNVNKLQVSGSARITNNLTVTGSLTVNPSGSFVLPLTSSISPTTGSMYWSGSLLFVYNGTRYMSASFV